jgi:NAD(P)-dependent dehydrogenase (short-subunit alcohol dehydrogenase family)
MNQLNNKIAVITGGAAGLGAATARLFAREGAKVVVGDVNATGGQATIQAIEAEGGVARFVPTDVTCEADVIALMRVAEQDFGGLDVLVTCAGILLSASTRVDQFETEAWDQVIDVNLKGTFLCVKHAVRLMEKRGGGVVLMIASGAGIRGGSSSVAYAASKGGVQGLGLAMVSQVEPLNIRVHVVLPANMATFMRVNAVGEMAEKAGKSRDAAMAAERASLPSPEGTANFLADLASDGGALAKGTLTLSAGDWEQIRAK